MKREVIRTADGSPSLRISQWDESYHSIHGAVQESLHVFIRMGLEYLPFGNNLNILEMGFGTGLNALLTAIHPQVEGKAIRYTGLEAFPLSADEWQPLDYPSQVEHPKANRIYEQLHRSAWGMFNEITPGFELRKLQVDVREFEPTEAFDLIYYDAFGARVQPELWTAAIFETMYRALRPGGVLVTYAAKGSVRRAMQEVGFQVERLPGPPGKREMLRASKP
ncbi:tRNA U34 5-methylaminomethyl-2-thiouridine-forming methyltransferase MnmC [Robiginitalea myxolifaciens]|uniref:tRNA U34 5-methylaminomethyl-2-thiouridine-forming methyltransferase MnmC n=1 Tax=Robiginitalea myxolifaciens TaxID=400055 RepID=A0A1I6H9Q7_9FLAO|nr:tRNA (5-methylaminomethyl-2-thiouridine)(34)-methyltransferase MnmD [Robiginitalea myxolifaciens]SFR51080.1 tRNA U34 5-methylaminomethyl-2-thiouridine-forming methyltransferase MnmC [Robiginitalea myxolifaciens]